MGLGYSIPGNEFSTELLNWVMVGPRTDTGKLNSIALLDRDELNFTALQLCHLTSRVLQQIALALPKSEPVACGNLLAIAMERSALETAFLPPQDGYSMEIPKALQDVSERLKSLGQRSMLYTEAVDRVRILISADREILSYLRWATRRTSRVQDAREFSFHLATWQLNSDLMRDCLENLLKTGAGRRSTEFELH